MARSRSLGVTAFAAPLAALTVLVLVAACNATPAPSPSGSSGVGPSGSPTGQGADAVRAATTILNAAKLHVDASMGAVVGIRYTAAGTEAAAAVLASGATGDQLWAATYVYASSGTDLGPLRKLMADATASASVRAMAAAALVGNGDTAGFEPLIAALGSPDELDGSEPAGTIWEFAADVLERYTQTGFGPTLTATDAERSTIQGRWTAWLEANRAKLRFDAAAHLWVTA
jgi:hypothetical protein